MTQRERQTPDGGAQAPSRLAAEFPAANGSGGCWEDLVTEIPAARRQELLALADRQGLLYVHQLGPVSPRHPLFSALLHGQVANLEPLHPPAVMPIDPDLDDAQREAVARALHTPDVCLIQGQPGTGKSRVVAEIIVQAAVRGERVLLVAAGAAALDCVLERIGTHEALFPLRCLAPDERAEALPACVRRLTFAERLRAFEEQTLGAARRSLGEATRDWEARRRDEAVWPRLEGALARIVHLDAELQNLAGGRDGFAGEVLAEAERPAEPNGSAFQAELARIASRNADALARIESRQAEHRTATVTVQAQRHYLETEVQPLLALAEAKRTGQWWTAAWWRAVFGGNVGGRLEELQKQLQELSPLEARLKKEADDLADERSSVDGLARTERDAAVGAETTRRLAAADARAAAAADERGAAESEWQAACRELTDAALIPAGPSAEALRMKRLEWEAGLKQAEQRRAAAAQSAAGLEQALPTLPEQLARYVNLVVATPCGLAQDVRFGEGVAPPATFDLLIFEEADQATEADFLQAARRARRWVFVGEPQPDDLPPPRPTHGRVVRPSALRPGCFQRLWRNLRWDPRRLPYSWEQRDGRLHCRLRAVPREQESWVQSERLADRPDVELHILSRPHQEPELVEVVFPASTSVPEAKEYLYRELGEVTLQAASADWQWAETAERVILRLTPVADPNAVLVPLCAGVRELVAPAAGDENDETAEWRTCAVEFDRSAGWDRTRACGWAAEQLRLRDLCRSTLLTVPHRTCPALAAWLMHLLDGQSVPTGGAPGEMAFEFVAVPTGAAGDEPRRRGEEEHRVRSVGGAAVATRLRHVKGGAGLETDLTDSRRIDQMPADLRAALPPRGVVNYLEAQALIRRLEGMLADDSFRAAAERWQQNQARPCEHQGAVCAAPGQTTGRPAHCPAVAIVALYPTQGELISRMLQRVPALLASPVTVEVGTPSSFRHRECMTALVSLTRSHTHRAVPFGDGPEALALALTRAAERVILFGDPGTLARRSQWQGALDHLDDTAAERERAVLARLVRAVHETEATLPVFRPREGNRA